MDRNDWFFFGGVSAAFIIAGIVFVLFRFVGSEAAPGWVQAIGSLMALAVAIFVPYLTARVARQQAIAARIERSQELVFLLAGEVSLVLGQIALLKVRSRAMPQAQISGWKASMRIELPPRIEWAVFDSAGDGPTLKPLINMVIGRAAYNGYVEQLDDRDALPANRTDTLNDLYERLDLIHEHGTEIMRQMERSLRG